MTYTSVENDRVKEIKKLQLKKYRDLTGTFIVEGEHLIEEAYNAIYDAVESGEISETQITESVQRIMETKIKRGIVLSNTDLLK